MFGVSGMGWVTSALTYGPSSARPNPHWGTGPTGLSPHPNRIYQSPVMAPPLRMYCTPGNLSSLKQQRSYQGVDSVNSPTKKWMKIHFHITREHEQVFISRTVAGKVLRLASPDLALWIFHRYHHHSASSSIWVSEIMKKNWSNSCCPSGSGRKRERPPFCPRSCRTLPEWYSLT